MSTHTLHCLLADTRIFLAARSLWTNDFLDKYSIPKEICWQKSSSIGGFVEEHSSPTFLHRKLLMSCSCVTH